VAGFVGNSSDKPAETVLSSHPPRLAAKEALLSRNELTVFPDAPHICKRPQIDQIWGFIAAKQKNVAL